MIVLLLFAASANSAFAQSDTVMADKIAGVIAEHESNYPAQIWITGTTDSAGTDAVPAVAGPFERNVARAWAASVEGKTPTQHCAGFFNGMGMRLANEIQKILTCVIPCRPLMFAIREFWQSSSR